MKNDVNVVMVAILDFNIAVIAFQNAVTERFSVLQIYRC